LAVCADGEGGARVDIVLARGACRAFAEGGILDTVTTNCTFFAVGDCSATSFFIELSCRADDALEVVHNIFVLTNGADFACPSSSNLAGTNGAGGIGGAASVVSVGPSCTSAGGAVGFA